MADRAASIPKVVMWGTDPLNLLAKYAVAFECATNRVREC